MTVYPSNTPAKLVPRVLPTKIQVKINIYTLTQLFSEFDKTCKKRITPCALTEWERGFEQTKKCYLTEVISFFKTVKEYFEGIQTALIKEVKEMKEIFEQMKAEVEQNVVDKKCTEIERKNLLIENENLIADCLSNELTIVKLKVEISKLKHKIQKDDHSEMIKQFSNLDVDYLNLQLKYQHLKDRFGNNKSQTSLDAPEFDSFFEINKLKEKLQGKDNTIRKLKVQISHMNERRSEADRILDFKALDSQNIELTEHVTALQEQTERVNSSTEASGSKPTSNTKNNRILPAKSDNKKKVEDHHRNNKSNLKQENHVDSSISYKRCSKHMTGNRSRLKNFVKKFIGTVRFGNDHFGAIIGYGDYVIGDSVIFRVYYME
ncbi:hypothetical protein Tco_0550284 [Tanacetum coccineum]